MAVTTKDIAERLKSRRKAGKDRRTGTAPEYPRPQAAAQSFRTTAAVLGVTPHRLFQLIGQRLPSEGYRWLRGDQVMGSKYAHRIIHLMQLHIARKWDPSTFDPHTEWEKVGLV